MEMEQLNLTESAKILSQNPEKVSILCNGKYYDCSVYIDKETSRIIIQSPELNETFYTYNRSKIIETLDLPMRTYILLKRLGINYVHEILDRIDDIKQNYVISNKNGYYRTDCTFTKFEFEGLIKILADKHILPF